jgi:hypothetical protein
MEAVLSLEAQGCAVDLVVRAGLPGYCGYIWAVPAAGL